MFLHPEEGPKALDRMAVLDSACALLCSFGLPPQDMETVRDLFRKPFVESLPFFTPLEDGEEVLFDGFRLRSILTPGHAVGHLSWYEPESETLFCGDAVLAYLTPYPALEPNPRFPNGRAPSLLQFEHTLDTLQALSVRLACPSHGRHITDLPAAIRNARTHNARHIALVAEQLKAAPNANLFELSAAAFPHLQQSERVYLAACTTLAALDRLGCPLDPALRRPL